MECNFKSRKVFFPSFFFLSFFFFFLLLNTFCSTAVIEKSNRINTRLDLLHSVNSFLWPFEAVMTIGPTIMGTCLKGLQSEKGFDSIPFEIKKKKKKESTHGSV